MPLFFKNYHYLNNKIKELEHKKTNSISLRIAKYRAKQELKLMQRYFAKEFFDEPTSDEIKISHLKFFFNNENNAKYIQVIKKNIQVKRKQINAGFYFSVISAALFSIGSVYLILETLATLTFITLPLPAILAMSAICGAAYGLLTYNSLSDLVWNNTIQDWLKDLKNSIARPNKTKAILKVTLSIGLVVLAACLTIFTAGTWVTIGKHCKNLPGILMKIPAFISKILIPAFISAATLIFTLENTKNTLDIFIKAIDNFLIKTGFHQNQAKKANNNSVNNTLKYDDDKHKHDKEKNTRALYQKLNIFNIIIFCIEEPLRKIFFALHIASIGVTTDRVAGVPKHISAGLSMASEGFEDYLYFFNDTNDFPTQLIKLALSPIYALSVLWHWTGSKFTEHKVDFKSAWQQRFKNNKLVNMFTGLFEKQAPNNDDIEDYSVNLSPEWQQQKLLMQLSDYCSGIKGNDKLSNSKRIILSEIRQNIADVNVDSDDSVNQINSHLILRDDKKDKLSEYRSFWHTPGETTSSMAFMESLQSHQQASTAA